LIRMIAGERGLRSLCLILKVPTLRVIKNWSASVIERERNDPGRGKGGIPGVLVKKGRFLEENRRTLSFVRPGKGEYGPEGRKKINSGKKRRWPHRSLSDQGTPE